MAFRQGSGSGSFPSHPEGLYPRVWAPKPWNLAVSEGIWDPKPGVTNIKGTNLESLTGFGFRFKLTGSGLG